MAFRLRNKKYLITWSRAEGFTKSAAMHHIETIGTVEYAVVAEESHSDEGLHYHAVVVYKDPLNSRVNLFSTDKYVANVEKIKNTNADLARAIRYVKKDGNFIEQGEEPLSIKRLDRKEKISYIKANTILSCIESGHFSIAELRNVEWLKARLLSQRDDRPRIVYWLWGPTGSGKTKRAWELAKQVYTPDDIWVGTGNLRDFKNGYVGQRCAIFDDFRNGDIKFNEILTLCDRYPINVNVKGGYMPWLADLIIFTCPYKPEDLFTKYDRTTGITDTREDIGQLIRRIDSIIEMEIP